ncbi:dihydrolipoamide succinyltransferase [endosymbiont of Acanthamoeba sp. UWC8]|uniref:2-oxoglutarate dehydrogenase complex dihydrolipoyllysine-residue succinyltransferase n=1 Tax=endosymbiont of Acanthamoeba sp. UWC8 TaxID=86106 RepID=UPI0004D11418|nr:2-oxoglutarate dehydrogenase complex dihydrolipoyllysine-residue succinyltransferase [endosymbiont of Acanthamoeba sp. UWC8]AIF80718.1 dihydrolipoamide succinyltransferase [endosymbiont of Acanthamoeba sp. UWC8]
MSVNIVVPPLGESVTEATIAKWHKKEGEFINVDELLVEIETDKVTLEVNAPASGTIGEIKSKEGDLVKVGQLLGTMSEGNSKAATQPTQAEAPKSAPQPISLSPASSSDKILSPAASKLAAEKGVDVNQITGSGKDGRITKEDVLFPQQAETITSGSGDNSNREVRVKMTRLRKTIAQRLKESQNTAAILTTFNEVDMSEAFRIRKLYQEKFQEKHAIKLGFMSFFVKACVAALKEIPAVNGSIEGDDIIYKNYYDIGVAVGTEQGLVVPVLRDADKLSFAGVEKGIASLGKKARDGKLSMQDMMGGTFSITNGGTYGSLLSTPIINPPQSGILGMHNIIQRPVAVNGNVEIRPMMYVALSYDHRIIDGKEAVTFLVKIKELVENPEKLLFDI